MYSLWLNEESDLGDNETSCSRFKITIYSNEGAIAINEVMAAFLQEVVWRAINQASNEELTLVNLNHPEKILPQLV